jgi:predicted hydrocarbon binding protein
MPEVRGKFIRLAGLLMTLYPEQRDKADTVVYEATGKHWDQLEPAEWYDVEIFSVLLDAYASSSVTGQKALLTLGKKVFPTKKKLGELPADITTPMDLLIYSTKSFTEDHRGPGIRPVRVIRAEKTDVIFDIPNHGYDCMVDEGVYAGILEMFGITNCSVEQTKCKKKGDSSCEFHITW